MSERPPLLGDLVRMVIKMIVGGIVVIGLVSCGVATIAGAGANAGGGGKPGKPAEPDVLYGEEDSDNAIVRIDINGPILSHAPEDDGGFFSSIAGVTFGYDVKEDLLAAAEDEDVKAVLLFVRTPGGSIVGSQAIHDGVLAVKAAGKPVVAYVDTLSASGGVWSTAGADKIFADFGSLIGSVGVNFGSWLYYDTPMAINGGIFSGGVETTGGVKAQFIGAGLGKDLGNPFRPMSERERNLLNATADEFYQDFLDHVTKYRPMDRTALVEQHGAMIYANAKAEEFGYIDDTKNFQETLNFIAAEIGADGDDWKLIAPKQEDMSPFEAFFSSSVNANVQSEQQRIEAMRVSACAELTTGVVVMTPKALGDFCAAR